MKILEIKDVTVHFQNQAILQSIQLSVKKGEWAALIGESGSGKSVLASSIGGLLPSELRVSAGAVYYKGRNVLACGKEEMRTILGAGISYVFQNPQSVFSPFYSIGKQFEEVLRTHRRLTKQDRRKKALEMLEQVGLPADRAYSSYPFQLSGGQLQRASIAIAMMLEPELLIADEPTSSLDSLTAASILHLIKKMQDKTGCGVLFITHDLRQAKKYSDHTYIIKRGNIAESGPTSRVFSNPSHPYTKTLLSSIPSLRSTPDRLPVAYGRTGK
ncbi:ATP-binding cassette domain-containing protein [Bacillus mangrovi]|uniref:ATP-binding cassette domain-containing protein n=1 Tax=Metabacillus mangrovi TaxID=1491830 RepID=A0A7X2S6B6_9BACI|nr:ABC transporter ATP-binding protein [Metabacillus mangrovi]MTH54422.1 ATP-binding cassette domain-containing protein [Metabacillus mangrovi]